MTTASFLYLLLPTLDEHHGAGYEDNFSGTRGSSFSDGKFIALQGTTESRQSKRGEKSRKAMKTSSKVSVCETL